MCFFFSISAKNRFFIHDQQYNCIFFLKLSYFKPNFEKKKIYVKFHLKMFFLIFVIIEFL